MSDSFANTKGSTSGPSAGPPDRTPGAAARSARGPRGRSAPEPTDALRQAAMEHVFPVADELGRRFPAAAHALHLVGGSVRALLLGRPSDDLDLATDAHPDQTLALI